MIQIAAGDPQSPTPYANLLPIVRALAAAGNETLHELGFHPTQGGWVCGMRDPIDFQLVRDTFILPGTIDCTPEDDQIFDRGTWISLHGPGFRPHIIRS